MGVEVLKKGDKINSARGFGCQGAGAGKHGEFISETTEKYRIQDCIRRKLKVKEWVNLCLHCFYGLRHFSNETDLKGAKKIGLLPVRKPTPSEGRR